MNLDEQLRAALNLEADMRTAPPPDTESLISGGQTRRRRRNAAALGSGVLAVVLVGGGIYAANQIGGDPKADPPVVTEPRESDDPTEAGPPPYETSDNEPGTYRRVLTTSSTGELIVADWTFVGDGWDLGDHPVLEDGGDWAGVSVYSPLELAGTNACTDGYGWADPGRPVAGTIDAIGRQLTRLPQGTVVEGPTNTEAFGYPAVHLRVRIDDQCSNSQSVYFLADTEQGGHGISYWRDRPVDVVMDFLVLDVDGTPVVAEYWQHPGADDDLVSRVTDVRDSISIETVD